MRALQLKRILPASKNTCQPTTYQEPDGQQNSVHCSRGISLVSHSTLKKAILTRLGITQSARFSACLDPNPWSSETVSQVYHRTLDVALTCLRDCNSIEDCTTGSCLPPAATVGGTVCTRTEATYGTGHGPSRRKI